MISILSALALLQAVGEPTREALANGRWKTMATSQLAAHLLPPKLARAVAGHRVNPPITEDGAPIAVTFFGKPRASLDGFCERTRYYVPVSTDSAMSEGVDIRLGPCPTGPNDQYAHVNPGTEPAEAKGALRWLANAREAARGSKALPFDMECMAEAEPNRCANGARAALATLPVDNAFIVDGSFNCQPGETSFAIKDKLPDTSPGGDPVWSIILVRADKQQPQLRLKWVVPAPF